MTTLHQQLTAAYTAHLAGNPDAAYARKAFDAGAKAGLEIAADNIEDRFGRWRQLRDYDEARFPGAPCEASDGVCFAAERMRALAREIA